MSRSTPAPRQSDIARLAGVSQWTVSVVVNGRAAEHHIPDGTQERVLRVARELGYVPNPAARNLRGGLNRLVGLVAYQSTFPLAQQSSFYGYLLGVEKEAERRGYDIVLFTSIVGAGRASGGNVYRDGVNRLKLADGAVMLGLEADRSELLRLSHEGYRFVYIGRREVPGAKIAYVAPDYGRAGADAVGALAQCGHRRIAYVSARGFDSMAEPHQDRYAGFAAARRAHGLPAGGDVALAEATPGWLRGLRANGITAAVVDSASAADQLAGRCRRASVRIPADVSVVVLDDAPGGPRRGTSWSCTAMPRETVGAQALSLLIEILQGEHESAARPPHALVPCGMPGGGTITSPAPG